MWSRTRSHSQGQVQLIGDTRIRGAAGSTASAVECHSLKQPVTAALPRKSIETHFLHCASEHAVPLLFKEGMHSAKIVKLKFGSIVVEK